MLLISAASGRGALLMWAETVSGWCLGNLVTLALSHWLAWSCRLMNWKLKPFMVGELFFFDIKILVETFSSVVWGFSCLETSHSTFVSFHFR